MSQLTIHYPETADGKPYQVSEQDLPHFHATVNRALTWLPGGSVGSVEVHLGERTKPKTTSEGKVYDEGGWLEHAIIIRYAQPSNGKMVIGAIQRRPGEQSEFHS